jgi:7-carboxy-7-deazaguanine synthase
MRIRIDSPQGHGTHGWVSEIFESIQGEGPYCGQRHIFLRLAGCNLECNYCDTVYAQEPNPPECRVRTSGQFRKVPNPVSVDWVSRQLSRFRHATWVTVTGGEPLFQVDYLKQLLAESLMPYHVYLETNGTLHKQLREVVSRIDIVAMDMKLPSVTKREGLWDLHREFLRTAVKTEVFVKVVVGPDTDVDEIVKCAKLVANEKPSVVLVLQPLDGIKIDVRRLLQLQDAALYYLDDVRIVPQIHKMLRIK